MRGSCRWVKPLVVAATLGIALGGCGPAASSRTQGAAPAPPAPQEAAPKVAPVEQPAKKLRKTGIGYVAFSAVTVPVLIAEEKGYFRKYGLDTESIFVQGGPAVIKAVMGGDLDFGLGPASGAAQARAEGGDMAIIAVQVQSLPFEIWSKPAVSRPQDLKGRTLAITKRGATTDFAARFLLKKWGLQPDTDVAVAEIGEISAVLGAMESGAIDAAVLETLQAMVASEKYQMRRLGGVRDEGLKYLYGTWVTRRSLIEQEPDTVMAFVKAFVEGIATFKQDKAFAIDVLRRHTKQEDMALLEKDWELNAKTLFESAPYPTAEGFKAIQEELSAINPSLASMKPEEVLEPRFVRELDQSGFVSGLYK